MENTGLVPAVHHGCQAAVCCFDVFLKKQQILPDREVETEGSITDLLELNPHLSPPLHNCH